MYSPHLIAIRRRAVESVLAPVLPLGLREYTTDEVLEFREERFKGLFDKKGNRTRELTQDETQFVINEQALTKIDYRYFGERYWTVNLAGQTLGPLFPLWESQTLILDQLADIEWEHYQNDYPDGVIADILKARQLGASTQIISMIGHRLVTHGNVAGLLASDVPDNSNFLYDMFERGVDHLPWYLRPTILERVKNDEMVFGTGSLLMMGASKSTRGADKSESGSGAAGKKGQLGRGKTVSMVHLSELATWTNPSQINSALQPGIPASPFTFWIKESTAQGRGPHNWWYMDWQAAKAGKGRSRAIFIPWYAEKEKYWLPCSAEWVPNQETLSHARRIEETSPRWFRGKVYRPTREQLFWYESARTENDSKGLLEEFLQEYPADDEEAFQMSGRSVFKVGVRERIRTQSRPLSGLVEIQSHREMGL
jgi:hypothetical protein